MRQKRYLSIYKNIYSYKGKDRKKETMYKRERKREKGKKNGYRKVKRGMSVCV